MERSSYPDSTRIQDEHRILAEHIGRIQKAIYATPQEDGIILSELRELVVVAREHFRREETIMQRQSYSDFLLHKRDHEYLLRNVIEFIASFVDGRAPASASVAEGFQSWLDFHIKKYDAPFLEFMTTRQA
jgi:methyl-accepting chemotaxis protein